MVCSLLTVRIVHERHRANEVRATKARTADAPEDTTPAERGSAMTWAQRLKRVFDIDIETCNSSSGHVKLMACIEDRVMIEKVLPHTMTKILAAPLSERRRIARSRRCPLQESSSRKRTQRMSLVGTQPSYGNKIQHPFLADFRQRGLQSKLPLYRTNLSASLPLRKVSVAQSASST
ncbi:MAG: hypothetical protein ACI8PT_001723 [Gammaproteobacteria bacterium]|jgi:hypothetical protein